MAKLGLNVKVAKMYTGIKMDVVLYLKVIFLYTCIVQTMYTFTTIHVRYTYHTYHSIMHIDIFLLARYNCSYFLVEENAIHTITAHAYK